MDDDDEYESALDCLAGERSVNADDLPGIALTELLRLGHAYLSIEDPQRRLAALQMLEAVAQADCNLGPLEWRKYRGHL